MAQYEIRYNGKTYNKKQFLNEIGLSDSTWRKYQSKAYYSLSRQGIEIHTDEEYYDKVIPKTVELLLSIADNKDRQSKIKEHSNKELEKPVVLCHKAFYTFNDIEKFIESKEFNYEAYLDFKRNRKTAFSIEDFIAKLYRDNGSFKLRLLHVLGKIDAGTYTLAVKSMNKYMVRNKSRYEDDNEQFSTISADDAIRMACGIMNCNIRDIHITDLITSRHN